MRRLAFLALLLTAPTLAVAAGRAAAVAQAVRNVGLDPQECYRVRDLRLVREDAKFFLTDGYLALAKPVEGKRFAAVFVADSEPGDGEVLVVPPTRAERQSLAAFTKAPTLNEHIRSALFLFTDDTAEALQREIRASESTRRAEEIGLVLAQTWDPVFRNLSGSFLIRLVEDLLRPGVSQRGFFFAALGGKQLGNFDVIVDPTLADDVVIGQVTERDLRPYFDTWTRFPSRRRRQSAPAPPSAPYELRDIALQVNIDASLHTAVTTTATLEVRQQPAPVVAFTLSRQMRMTGVRLDGQPVEFLQPESLRAGLLRGNDNDAFLVVPGEPLQPGRAYRVEFSHEGDVIRRAGPNVYFVGARTSWYPHLLSDFTPHTLEFRYPKSLMLVATGMAREERVEGEWKIARYATETPVRLAGFNLGQYEKATATRGGFTVDVYANQELEVALQSRPREAMIVQPPTPFGRGQRRFPEVMAYPTEPPRPDPKARLRVLADDVGRALEYFASIYGPPPLPRLTVSPIPAAIGQGFPGLLYLSTLSYLDPAQRPGAVRNPSLSVFFSDLLQAHETAHQWWGNLVSTDSERDDWLIEALANYSALLWLEKQRGRRALDQVLGDYRDHLLNKLPDGRPLEAVGPITWGLRLQQSAAPQAWRVITYEKGTWILHMLRRRLGDPAFLTMLRAMRDRFQRRAMRTEDLQQLAREFAPRSGPDPKLESFFEQWVYGTGVPALKLDYAVKGKAPSLRLTGTVTQSGVDEDVSVDVPIEVQFARGPAVTHWVRTGPAAASFSVALKQAPARVVLDPQRSVLRAE